MSALDSNATKDDVDCLLPCSQSLMGILATCGNVDP